MRSHCDQFHSLPLTTDLRNFGGSGSREVNSGSHRFVNTLEKAVTGFSCNILYNSKQIVPATKPVVVAIAGVILAAIPL